MVYQSEWINRVGVGDLVLVKMPNRPRPFWLHARVLEVYLGYVDKIISAKLRRAEFTVYHYSICHLYPLELSLTHQHNENLANDNDTSTSREQADKPTELTIRRKLLKISLLPKKFPPLAGL